MSRLSTERCHPAIVRAFDDLRLVLGRRANRSYRPRCASAISRAIADCGSPRVSVKSVSRGLDPTTKSATVTSRTRATLAKVVRLGTTSPRSNSLTYPRPRPHSSTKASKENSRSRRISRMCAPTRRARGSGSRRCRFDLARPFERMLDRRPAVRESGSGSRTGDSGDVSVAGRPARVGCGVEEDARQLGRHRRPTGCSRSAPATGHGSMVEDVPTRPSASDFLLVAGRAASGHLAVEHADAGRGRREDRNGPLGSEARTHLPCRDRAPRSGRLWGRHCTSPTHRENEAVAPERRRGTCSAQIDDAEGETRRCPATPRCRTFQQRVVTIHEQGMEAPPGIEPGNGSFAGSCLTAWLRCHRAKGLPRWCAGSTYIIAHVYKFVQHLRVCPLSEPGGAFTPSSVMCPANRKPYFSFASRSVFFSSGME